MQAMPSSAEFGAVGHKVMEVFSESHWVHTGSRGLGAGAVCEGGTSVLHPPGFSQERLSSNTHGPSPILPTEVGK